MEQYMLFRTWISMKEVKILKQFKKDQKNLNKLKIFYFYILSSNNIYIYIYRKNKVYF